MSEFYLVFEPSEIEDDPGVIWCAGPALILEYFEGSALVLAGGHQIEVSLSELIVKRKSTPDRDREM